MVVRVRKGVADLGDDMDGLAWSQPALLLQQGSGVDSLDKLHDDEVLRHDPRIQDGDDVRNPPQARGQLRFAAKAPDEQRVKPG